MTRRLSRETLIKWAPLLVLLTLVIFFTALNPTFFSLRNFARIAIAAAPALMVAIGVTFIIIMGSIDLSMEGTVSLTAVASYTLRSRKGRPRKSEANCRPTICWRPSDKVFVSLTTPDTMLAKDTTRSWSPTIACPDEIVR